MSEPVRETFVDEVGQEENEEDDEDDDDDEDDISSEEDEEGEGEDQGTEMITFISQGQRGISEGNEDDLYLDEHDQLPTLEEVQTSNAIAKRKKIDVQQTEGRNGSKKDCDISTGTLVCILISVVTAFFLTLFLAEDDRGETRNHGIVDYEGNNPVPANPYYDLSAIEQALRDGIALDHGEEFDNAASYQSKAMLWMVSKEYVYSFYPTDRLAQLYALACFHYATNPDGLAWMNKFIEGFHDEGGWLKADDPCTWPGVHCDLKHLVVRLDLDHAGLQGRLIPELQLLSPSLKDLVLDDNAGLTGFIPSYLANMDLGSLTLTETGLGGSMPGQICDYKQRNPNFSLLIDCDNVFCQPICCEDCQL